MMCTPCPPAARTASGLRAPALTGTIPLLVAQALRVVPIDRVMRYVGQVACYDRYQASAGIEAAATVVADAARAIGLCDVSVEYFPADGKPDRWWTFQAPTAWTPRVAWIEVRTAGGAALRIDHAQLPSSIATYSAATPAGGVRAVLATLAGHWREFNGAVVLLEPDELGLPDVVQRLVDLGAAGFISASATGSDAEGQHAARIELPVPACLFGFSVTPAQFGILRQWAATGASVHAEVVIDGSARMPVVSGTIPGRSTDEVWLTAHLCHPRPGANDNASGVAALLGIAESMLALPQAPGARSHASKSLRFLWCPEFVGTAAALHGRIAGSGRTAHPDAVINLDMVGEDQRRCGSPFVLERTPDTRPSPLVPIAESVIDEVFVQTAASGGEWRSLPFHGYSDHALFAGPGLGCPAIQLAHWPDRFNHTAADTLDKVSPIEMTRSTAIGTVLAQLPAAMQPCRYRNAWRSPRAGACARRHWSGQCKSASAARRTRPGPMSWGSMLSGSTRN
jgi:hypothetical protein